MSDPLRDPDYPNRPQHKDFWRLSELILELDADATDDENVFENVITDIVDTESLVYMAHQRAIRVFDVPDANEAFEAVTAMMSLWVEGFVTGVRYQQKRSEDGKNVTADRRDDT